MLGDGRGARAEDLGLLGKVCRCGSARAIADRRKAQEQVCIVAACWAAAGYTKMPALQSTWYVTAWGFSE